VAIDPNGAKTLNAQVKADVVRRIGTGEYPVGEKIPSLRALAEQYGVAELTVHAAVKELQHEGVLESVAGRGTFVRALPAERSNPDLATQLAELRGEFAELRARVEALEASGHQDR
jgi:DNA-binding GntR family transcriptional regulator